ATSGERTDPGQGLGREVQREIVLRVSDCDKGPYLRRQRKVIHRVQTGARSTTCESSKYGAARPTADGWTVFGAHARDGRTAQCGSPAVRWIWTDGRKCSRGLVKHCELREKAAA